MTDYTENRPPSRRRLRIAVFNVQPDMLEQLVGIAAEHAEFLLLHEEDRTEAQIERLVDDFEPDLLVLGGVGLRRGSGLGEAKGSAASLISFAQALEQENRRDSQQVREGVRQLIAGRVIHTTGDQQTGLSGEGRAALRPGSEWLGEIVRKLSPRQREVLFLLSRGLKNREIAQQLGLSTHTVKGHISDLFARFDVSNRTELAAEIAEIGFDKLLRKQPEE